MSCLLIFRDKNRKSELEPICNDVLRQYSLPQVSLRCIFDDAERPEFEQSLGFGASYRGFFAPVKQFGIKTGIWPWEIVDHFSDIERGVPFLCDAVIYLRRRTCDDRIGAAITFAHELQHFMQYTLKYKVWRAHQFIQHVAIPRLIDPRPWNFPIEHEAQLVSKRTSVAILGQEAVDRYADEQISNNDDPEKWRFFLSLDATEVFDLLEATRPWVLQYKDEIIDTVPGSLQRSGDPDFTKDDWWN